MLYAAFYIHILKSKLMKLTSENVNSTFLKCLFKKDENTEKHIAVEGVMLKVGFNPDRLKESEQTIIEMLNDLPDSFKPHGGGGMSFLNMCQDKNDNQWTGFHKTVDELVCLGIAIGKVSFLMPREMWSVLPGGMPYIAVS
jgi:hypothetical protein